MTLTDLLVQLTRITYILIGLITLVDWLRHRDRARLDVALLFIELAGIILIQELNGVAKQSAAWLGLLIQILLMAHPLLLLRVVEHFWPVGRGVRWFAALGLLVSWILLFFLTAAPIPISLVLVGYFVILELYAVAALVQGALTTRGVSRWRFTLAALGSGFIAAVLVVVGLVVLIPSLQPYIALLNQVFSVLSGICYYLGFATPRWLLRSWQLPELYNFLNEAAGRPVEVRGQHTLGHLCNKAIEVVGGRAALAALWDPKAGELTIQGSTNPDLQGVVSINQGVTGQAWQSRRPAFARSVGELAPESRRFADALHTNSLIAVPIATPDRLWGLLIVLVQRPPLFPNDDMALLTLFAEQSALALEQWELFTQQKTLVSEQQKLVADLRERTSQLEESNSELEAFSYSVSHDLRAPLRHIEGFAELLGKGGSLDNDEKGKRHLLLITEAARRMGILIDNLLTFSRLGRTPLSVTPVELAAVLEEARHDVQLDAEGRAVEWQIDPLPRVYGDAGLLRLVLVNLLSNALKYSRQRPQTQIHIGVLNDQPGQVTIFVRDNGVGFDMQYSDKLFGVFQRLHHNDEFEGTGIGLANVRRIINRHGGRAWAESTLDEGATFYFSLPLGPAITTTLGAATPPPLPSFPFSMASLTSGSSGRPFNNQPPGP